MSHGELIISSEGDIRTDQRIVTAKLQQGSSESLLNFECHLSSYIRTSGKRNKRYPVAIKKNCYNMRAIQ